MTKEKEPRTDGREDSREWKWTTISSSMDSNLAKPEWDMITYLTIAKRVLQGLVIMLLATLLIMTIVQPWKEYAVFTEKHVLGNQSTDVTLPVWLGETLCYLDAAYSVERWEQYSREWMKRDHPELYKEYLQIKDGADWSPETGVVPKTKEATGAP